METFINDNKIKNIIDKIKEDYILEWRHQLGNSSKFRFYNKVKKEYKLEEYLTAIKNSSQRRLYTKFRISNHKLLIEYGRYQEYVNTATWNRLKVNFILLLNVKNTTT